MNIAASAASYVDPAVRRGGERGALWIESFVAHLVVVPGAIPLVAARKARELADDLLGAVAHRPIAGDQVGIVVGEHDVAAGKQPARVQIEEHRARCRETAPSTG